ncbi:hypothetical protein TWF730_004569 [Orbilia blumenaviensis]|uniref:Uncharacterized protein n=1 Tax=Orbilia blumenaviensis TaxID=1796055 RepID=A0AAV9TY76_9PEZI
MFESLEPKRPRLMGEVEAGLDEEPRWDDGINQDVFLRSELFIPIDQPTSISKRKAVSDAFESQTQSTRNRANNRKRIRELAEDTESSLRQEFPQTVPRVPVLEERHVEVFDEKANPFCNPDGSLSLHPRTIALSMTRYSGRKVKERTSVNGLLKFTLWKTKGGQEDAPSARLYNLGSQSKASSKSAAVTTLDPNIQGVNYLPPNFGKNMKLDQLDQKIFRFYTLAICSGRTLLENQNMHLLEIAPMADKSEGVRHAVLSLTSAYLLDYRPHDAIAQKANYHYKQAISWLTKELSDVKNYDPGKEEALVTTLLLLIHNEVVCWEYSSGDKVPAWYKAIRIARKVLDNSDPGYRFKHLKNVQESKARHRIGNEIAFCEILSSAFAPIEEEDLGPKCPYSWLVGGTDKEVTAIEGNTGMCARVLYTLAQITYLTGIYAKDPGPEVWPIVAGTLRTRLERVQQWSELSEGYSHAQELLDACILDEDGLVKTKEEATDLIAESYIQAALIYLECRFFRRSPFHPSVRRSIDILIKCFDRCPTNGNLYTAQTPVFGVAIAGVVAIDEKERDFCRKYVRGTCSGEERGNLPTLDDSLKFIWEWMDKNRPSGENDNAPLQDRSPWWEDFVEAFYKAKNRRDFA